MSIRDIDTKGKDGGLDISELDLSPLFLEPKEEEGLSKIVPWINLLLVVVILVVVIVK